MRNRILIIDDEPNIRKSLASVLEDEGYEVSTAEDGEAGLKALKPFQPEVILLDVWLPGLSGIEILEKMLQLQRDLPIIMISGHASVDIAVKAVKIGAFDFIEKPLSVDRVITLVRNAIKLQELKHENRQLKKRLTSSDDFIGQSKLILTLKQSIEQAARTDAPVFISGENGTGKELVAREIHNCSNRNRKSFVAVNCAAIPETLIESELFGHEKGAFTGANAQKRGRFELAHEGSLFLDEIVDLSLSAQAKVLRSIQEQVFERVGGTESVRVSIRFIAASNKPVHQALESGRFREDLFYRLHVLPIAVPALRDRAEDIPHLVDYFVMQTTFQFLPGTEQHESLPSFTPEAMKLLQEQQWPGNIRQLKNIVQRILVLTTERTIEKDVVEYALAGDLQAGVPIQSPTIVEGLPPELLSLNISEARDEFERRFILQKLADHDYNISKTAQVLGMYPSNLHAKIKKFNIQVDR